MPPIKSDKFKDFVAQVRLSAFSTNDYETWPDGGGYSIEIHDYKSGVRVTEVQMSYADFGKLLSNQMVNADADTIINTALIDSDWETKVEVYSYDHRPTEQEVLDDIVADVIYGWGVLQEASPENFRLNHHHIDLKDDGTYTYRVIFGRHVDGNGEPINKD
jgi:hypothetical protein